MERFRSADVPAVINVSEFSRRFSEMNAFYGMEAGESERDMTIVINVENALISSFTAFAKERQEFIANQIYYLAMLSYKKLNPEELKDFSDNCLFLLKQYID